MKKYVIEDKNTLKYCYREKLLKAWFIIYADLECLLKKKQSCQNNPKNSYTREKLPINLRVTHGVSSVCLMKQKTDANFIEKKIVSKSFVKM